VIRSIRPAMIPSISDMRSGNEEQEFQRGHVRLRLVLALETVEAILLMVRDRGRSRTSARSRPRYWLGATSQRSNPCSSGGPARPCGALPESEIVFRDRFQGRVWEWDAFVRVVSEDHLDRATSVDGACREDVFHACTSMVTDV
jgi:hypothetical protein